MLHVLIVLSPALLYQTLLENTKIGRSRYRNFLIGIIGGVASGLCIAFPIVLPNHVIWDLRFVPLILAALYLNYQAWLPVLLILLLVRTAHGGPAVAGAYCSAVLTCAVSVLMGHTFRRSGKGRKTGLVIALGIAAQLISFGTLMVYTIVHGRTLASLFHTYQAGFFLTVVTFQILATLFPMLVLENSRETALLRKNLQDTERNHLIGQMAASIAHEIRNPITVVRGFLQLLGGRTDDKGRTYIDLSIGELDRAESIIMDYLDLSKPNARTRCAFDASEVLTSLRDVMTPMASMNCAEIRVYCEHPLWVEGDEAECKQGLVNIVKNSLEAGATVVDVKGMAVAKTAIISITDNGHGIPPDVLERIGTPFYSTKSKGTGLGLTVTTRLFKAMGGSLEYVSEVGKGTTATVTVPAAKRTAPGWAKKLSWK